ncbi:MAG TPA: hypothetical protein VMS55_00305 [Myxococcota bacterium]|nr:hypothetical protein [Myxococcota bacterium]
MNVEEAILRHGGEALASRNRFAARRRERSRALREQEGAGGFRTSPAPDPRRMTSRIRDRRHEPCAHY